MTRFLHLPIATPRAVYCLALLVATLALPGCGARAPEHLETGMWTACPGSPNCVTSLAVPTNSAWVAPFIVSGPPDDAWAAALEIVESMSRTRVVTATDRDIHAVVDSALFRFEDDLQLRLDRTRGLIDVRSASRRGFSDMGVNRRRVEGLRHDLIERGVVSAERTDLDPAPRADEPGAEDPA